MKADFCRSLWIICLFFLYSCERSFDYPYDYPGDHMVVFGTLCPQSLEVFVYKSVRPLDNVAVEDLKIADAEVMVYDDSGVVGQLVPAGKGRYLFPEPIQFEPEHPYYLEVSHPSYESTISEPVAIPAFQREAVRFQYRLTGDLWFGNSNSPVGQIHLELPDPPGQHYYLIVLEALTRPSIQLEAQVSEAQNFNLCEIVSSHPPYGIYMTDICFENQLLELDLLAGIDNVFRLRDTTITYSDLKLSVSSIDSNYYHYLQSGIPLEGLTGISEPRPTLSNFSNGFGVFRAANNTSFQFAK